MLIIDKEIIENYIIIASIYKVLSKCILSILRGIGQIFLQANSITGILFIIAMLYENWRMGLVAIGCTIISTITAKLARFNDENIMNGLYGFNSSLIGCALTFYFELSFLVVVCFIIGSIVSTFVMELFIKSKLPSYTFPFILVTWILLAIMHNERFPVKEKSPSPIIDYKVLNDYSMPSHSFGQVIFLGDTISGLLVLIGCYISSPIGTIYGIVSTIISQGISLYFNGTTLESAHAGLYGFNAVLVGVALGGKKTIDGLYVLVALIISSCFYIMVVQNEFTGLTFPFVLGSWFIRLVKWIVHIKYNKKESIIYHLKVYFNNHFIIVQFNHLNNKYKNKNKNKIKNNNNNNNSYNNSNNINYIIDNNNKNNNNNNNNSIYNIYNNNNDIITNNEIIMKPITPLNNSNVLLEII